MAITFAPSLPKETDAAVLYFFRVSVHVLFFSEHQHFFQVLPMRGERERALAASCGRLEKSTVANGFFCLFVLFCVAFWTFKKGAGVVILSLLFRQPIIWQFSRYSCHGNKTNIQHFYDFFLWSAQMRPVLFLPKKNTVWACTPSLSCSLISSVHSAQTSKVLAVLTWKMKLYSR